MNLKTYSYDPYLTIDFLFQSVNLELIKYVKGLDYEYIGENIPGQSQGFLCGC